MQYPPFDLRLFLSSGIDLTADKYVGTAAGAGRSMWSALVIVKANDIDLNAIGRTLADPRQREPFYFFIIVVYYASMSVLYIASHGPTVAQEPHGLNDRGWEQALALGAHVAEHVPDIARAVVLTSPSLRTRQVGNAIVSLTGIEAVYDHPLLWEISQSEEIVSADGLHFVAEAVLSHNNQHPSSFDQILMVTHPEVMNRFAGRKFDAALPKRIRQPSKDGARNAPLMYLLGHRLRPGA